MENNIPTLEELVNGTGRGKTPLQMLLQQDPPTPWLKEHPTATVKTKEGQVMPLLYLPIERVEYLLQEIFGGYKFTIHGIGQMANSAYLYGQLTVVNPETGKTETQEGVGAFPIEVMGTEKANWNKATPAAVMLALPAAESFAIKDAAEKFGRIFGKDLARTQTTDYAAIYDKRGEEYDWEKLGIEWAAKKAKHKGVVTAETMASIDRIISGKEKKSYKKVVKYLSELK